jgi:stage II sporulation protein D
MKPGHSCRFGIIGDPRSHPCQVPDIWLVCLVNLTAVSVGGDLPGENNNVWVHTSTLLAADPCHTAVEPAWRFRQPDWSHMAIRGIRLRAAALVAAIAATGTALVSAMPTATAVEVIVIDGRGFGHGVGLSQDGAYWMARAGRSDQQILQHFFPGAKPGKGGGPVRVPLGSGSASTVAFADGGIIRAGGRELAIPPGSTVTVKAGAGVATATLTVKAAAPGTTAAPALDPVAVGEPAAKDSSPINVGGRGFSVVVAQAGPDTTTTNPAPATPLTTASPVAPPTVIDGATTTSAPPLTASPSSVDPAGETLPPTLEDASGNAATGGGGKAVTSTTAAPLPRSGPGAATAGTTSTSTVDASTGPTTTVAANALTGPTVALSTSTTMAFGGKKYRGTIEFQGMSSGMKITTVIDVEDYLRGMGEIRDPRWPQASLRAQAIAARTYALDTMNKAGEVCPTQRCQVYLGAQAEYPAMDQAVAATAGQVLTYGGKLILAFYSASGGGTIATPTEAFGPSNVTIPYLRAGSYLTGDVQRWEVRVGLAEMARRLGYPGTANGVTVSKVGPSGRPLEVTMTGSAGPRSWTGIQFDRSLGLRSNQFSFRREQAATAPTLPPIVEDLPTAAQAELITGTTTTTATSATATSAVEVTSTPSSLSSSVDSSTTPESSTAGSTSSTTNVAPPSAGDSSSSIAAPVAADGTGQAALGSGDASESSQSPIERHKLPLAAGLGGVCLVGAAALMARRFHLEE